MKTEQGKVNGSLMFNTIMQTKCSNLVRCFSMLVQLANTIPRISACVMLAVLALLLTAQAQDSATNGLVAYYPFNSNANDESGNDNHGTLHGTPQLVADWLGAPSAAYSLNGSTDWISVPGAAVLNLTNDLTMALWVKPKIAENSTHLALVSYSDEWADQYAIAFTPQNRMQFTYFTGFFHDTVDLSDAVWTDNIWHHVCVVVDTSSKVVRFYKNGTLLSSVSQDFSPPIPSLENATLQIGINPGENDYFPGCIDEVRVYSRALADAEVRALVGQRTMRYVWQESPSPGPPYTDWATAAHVIQDAVDAAVAGDTVLVAGGVYATGGRAVYGSMTNRVAVDRAIRVESLMRPDVTIIRGYQVPGITNGDGAIRCAYLACGASLSGFTLTNGATRSAGDWEEESGGGLWCESSNAVVSNCVLAGNSAYSCGGGACLGTLNNCTLTGNSAGTGGGAFGDLGGNSSLNNCTVIGNSAQYAGGVSSCILNNCRLIGNFASWQGGGAIGGSLNNCTVVGNSAEVDGGVAADCLGAFVDNCIIYSNTAAEEPNWTFDSTLNSCCTTPMPANGVGNITNAPPFVDYAGGNLRLQSNSPCINAGNNAYAPGPTDLDGNPRIVHGTVDIGAYEFQGPGSAISYAWLRRYGLTTDGSADTTDPDADGHTTRQEWRCQTDPTNALSVLRLLSASRTGTAVTVRWQSVEGVSYFLERSTNLLASPPFTLLAPNLPGQPGVMSFTDTNAAAVPRFFYRVGVP